MKTKKILTSILAGVMAISALSVSAFAKTPIYDGEEIIGYIYNVDDIKDSGNSLFNFPKTIAKLNSTRTSTSAPTYASAISLDSGDYADTFSLSGYGSAVYTKAFRTTADVFGIRFYNVGLNLDRLSLKLYKINTDNSLQSSRSITFDYGDIGVAFSTPATSWRYCCHLESISTAGLSGDFIMTNDIDSVGLVW